MNSLDELIRGPVMTQLTTLVALRKTVNHYIIPFSLYYTFSNNYTLGHSVVCLRTAVPSHYFTVSKKQYFGGKLLLHFHEELINIFPDLCCF